MQRSIHPHRCNLQKLRLKKGKDGTVYVPVEGDLSEVFKIGDRLVWTLQKGGEVVVKKRTKRYKLRDNEYESMVVETPPDLVDF
jgi:hypothetical protein